MSLLSTKLRAQKGELNLKTGTSRRFLQLNFLEAEVISEDPGDDIAHPNHKNNNPNYPFVHNLADKMTAFPPTKKYNPIVQEAKDEVKRRLTARSANASGRLPKNGRFNEAAAEFARRRLPLPAIQNDKSLKLVSQNSARFDVLEDLFHVSTNGTERHYISVEEAVELLVSALPAHGKISTNMIKDQNKRMSKFFFGNSLKTLKMLIIGGELSGVEQDRFSVRYTCLKTQEIMCLYLEDTEGSHPDNPLSQTKPAAKPAAPAFFGCSSEEEENDQFPNEISFTSRNPAPESAAKSAAAAFWETSGESSEEDEDDSTRKRKAAVFNTPSVKRRAATLSNPPTTAPPGSSKKASRSNKKPPLSSSKKGSQSSKKASRSVGRELFADSDELAAADWASLTARQRICVRLSDSAQKSRADARSERREIFAEANAERREILAGANAERREILAGANALDDKALDMVHSTMRALLDFDEIDVEDDEDESRV